MKFDDRIFNVDIYFSSQLANAVQQLVDEGNRVLVIGRKHMERWPRMDSIRQNATVFLVENM